MEPRIVEIFPNIRVKRERAGAFEGRLLVLNAGKLELAKPPQPRVLPKRSKNGCLNCKKLKIKCDEGKPFCGYCVHTSRHCLYAPSSSPASASYALELSKQLELDAIRSMLACSQQEVNICRFFLSDTVHIFSMGQRPEAVAVLRTLTPQFFNRSPMYREACLALGAVHAWSLHTNVTPGSVKYIGHEGAYHFRKAVSHLRKMAQRITEFGYEHLTSEEKDILSVTNQLVFAYSCLDPGLCDVALSNDPADMISFCHSISVMQRQLTPMLKENVAPLMYIQEGSYPIPENVEYPFVTSLRKQLRNYYFEYKLSMADYLILDEAVTKLQAVCFISVRFHYFLPFFRFLGSVGTKEFIFLLNKKHDPMAILIVLHYAAMSLFAQCCFLDTENQWTRYMETSKVLLRQKDRERAERMKDLPEGVSENFSWYHDFSWLFNLRDAGFLFRSPKDFETFGCESMVLTSRTY